MQVAKNQFANSFMNTKPFQAWIYCAMALGASLSFRAASTVENSADAAPAKASTAIPWSQIGARVGAGYQGDGLAVTPTAGGARLRCIFQRLEGEATREGLWLTSTAAESKRDRFRLVATALGRAATTDGSDPGRTDLRSTGRNSTRGNRANGQRKRILSSVLSVPSCSNPGRQIANLRYLGEDLLAR